MQDRSHLLSARRAVLLAKQIEEDECPYSESSLTFLTQVLGNFSCQICTHNFCKFLLLIFKTDSQWQMLNEKISQKFYLTVLFLGLKFCKNLGFSLSELCE
jgi:hypothetical protein